MLTYLLTYLLTYMNSEFEFVANQSSAEECLLGSNVVVSDVEMIV